MEYIVWLLTTIALLGFVALIYFQDKKARKQYLEEDNVLTAALRTQFAHKDSFFKGSHINPDPMRANPPARVRPLPPASILRREGDGPDSQSSPM